MSLPQEAMSLLKKRQKKQAKLRVLLEDKKVFEAAKEAALRLLRFRPRSVKEMCLRLKQKGYSDLIIASVIGELKEKNLLNDDVFAKLWINERLSFKPAGKILLTRELRNKGVEDAPIEKAFSEFKGNFDEFEIAGALARRRIERLRNLDEQNSRKKLFDFLRRRGFSDETVWKVLKDIYPVRENLSS